MEEFKLKVKMRDAGLRIDLYIIRNLKRPISRSRIQQLINTERILVNRSCVRPHYKVKANDTLLIRIPQSRQPKPLPEKIPLEILFEDEDLLVINKPTGMLTHPAANNYSHTLVGALLNYGCPLSTVSEAERPGIVHRLDKDTSGLIVVAKNDFAHKDLARQFRKHTVKRKYTAIVKGEFAHNEGIIDYPLARHPKNRKKIAVSFLGKRKSALTRYKVLKRTKIASVLELAPYTGRTHQLRVHLKFCGHPIIGDSRYGTASSFSRLALHATALGFRHPRSNKFVEFQSGIPGCFKEFIETLNNGKKTAPW